jgi:hypothetical protein
MATLPSRSLLETHARLVSLDCTPATRTDLSPSEQPPPPVRFFDRGEYFTVLGRDAMRLAQDVFHSTSVIKMIPPAGNATATDQGTPSLWVSRKQFATVLRTFLVRLRLGVEVWKLDNATGWFRAMSGTAGAVHQFADAVMDASEDPTQMLHAETGSLGCIVLKRIKTKTEPGKMQQDISSYGVSFASVNTVLQTFSAGYLEASDLNDALTHAQALVAQTPFAECAVVCAAGDPLGVQKPIRDLLKEEEGCVRRVLPRRNFERFEEVGSPSQSGAAGHTQATEQATRTGRETCSLAVRRCLQDCAQLLCNRPTGRGDGNESDGSEIDNTEGNIAGLDQELVRLIQISGEPGASGTLQAISGIISILKECHPELEGVRFTYSPCAIGGKMHLSQSAITALSLLPLPSTDTGSKTAAERSSAAGTQVCDSH